MGFFCGMTALFVLVSFCCHVYEFIKMADWQGGLRDLVLCNLKKEVSMIYYGFLPEKLILILN
jgi:hypothetical protein